MALGIQSAGIADQGIAPQGVIAAPVQEQTVQATEQVQNNNHADNWLKQDLDNPFIVPWGEFDVNPNIDFKSLLSSAYGGGVPAQRKFGIPMMGQQGGRTTTTSYGNTGANDLFGNLAKNSSVHSPQMAIGSFGLNQDRRTPAEKEAARLQPFNDAYKGTTNRINFADKNLDAAIDELNMNARGRLMPTYKQRTIDHNNAFGNIGGFDKPEAVPSGILANSYGWAPVSRLTDSAARDKMFSDVANKYGIRLDDLQTKYGTYDKAFRSLNEPVGANWQDLKSSPVYDKLLKDIRGYSADSTGSWDKHGTFHQGSTNDAYFDKINAMVPDYRSNPDFLPAEYFVLHQPKAVLPGRGGLGATPRDLGNQGLSHRGFSALPGHDPYARQDWTDYADGNKAAWQYTPAEVEAAKKAMAHHIDQLDNKLEDGGPFNLMKEANVTTPRAKGGKWYWKDSPYTGQLNAAQNMLYHNTQGEKNFRDAGYNENTAVKDSMRFQKKKKKGFMGGLGKVLKPVAQVLSFIPQTAMFARMYLAADALANKNPLGAVANVAGANFGAANAAGSLAGAGTSLAGSGAGYLADAMSGALGNTAANALVSGGLGAMSGYKSGNALKGGLTAALGSGVGGFKSDAIAKLSDSVGKLPAEALVNAGIGAGQGAIQGDAALGAILGGMGPMVNAGLGKDGLGLSNAASAFGTGAAKGVVQTKAQLDKQKKAIAKAIAQRNRGVS